MQALQRGEREILRVGKKKNKLKRNTHTHRFSFSSPSTSLPFHLFFPPFLASIHTHTKDLKIWRYIHHKRAPQSWKRIKHIRPNNYWIKGYAGLSSFFMILFSSLVSSWITLISLLSKYLSKELFYLFLCVCPWAQIRQKTHSILCFSDKRVGRTHLYFSPLISNSSAGCPHFNVQICYSSRMKWQHLFPIMPCFIFFILFELQSIICVSFPFQKNLFPFLFSWFLANKHFRFHFFPPHHFQHTICQHIWQ